MPWKQQGGGGGGGGGGPWGGGSTGGGGQPPDIDDILRKGQEKFKGMMPGGIGSKAGIGLIGLFVILALIYSAFYRVEPGHVGVQLLFGKYINQTAPGGHFWFPGPVGSVVIPSVERTNEITIGYRGSGTGTSAGGGVRTPGSRDVPEESLMLTGDQNIIDIDFIVQWRIKNAQDFLFNIRDPAATVKLAAESSIREIVGQIPLEDALVRKRGEVQTKTTALLQQILDDYGSGVFVVDVKLQKVEPPAAVIDAFDDVQRAKQDRERQQNEADAYANDILPKAQGEAARLVQEATAYREQLIKEAEGEAKRFLLVYEAYKGNKAVTTKRLYLERMQEVLKDANKIIIDSSGSGPGVVPYLPLPEIRKRSNAGQPDGGN